LALPYAAHAQVLYGSIVGNISDASQAAVSGATVTITNTETNLVRQATTSETGAYSVPNLPTGVYTLKVSKEGFTTSTQSQVVVTINSVSRIDARLNVGAVTESVTVSAEVATLQTDRSEVRQEIVSKQLVNLPVPLGRNYQQLFRVLPGFAPPVNAHSVPTNPSRAWPSTSTGPAAARITRASTGPAPPSSSFRTSSPTCLRSNPSRRSTW